MNAKRGVRLLLIAVAAYAVGSLLLWGSGLIWSNPSDVITAVALLGIVGGVAASAAGVVVLLGSAWKWTRRTSS